MRVDSKERSPQQVCHSGGDETARLDLEEQRETGRSVVSLSSSLAEGACGFSRECLLECGAGKKAMSDWEMGV